MENETKLFENNNIVILSLSVLESTLKTKHHSIHYNYVWVAVDSVMALIYKVDTGSNIADPLTKLLDKVNKKDIIQSILY